METLALVFGSVGAWFGVALALEFAAVGAEQMGAARKSEEGNERRAGFGAFALMLTTTLAPALLIAHALLATLDAPAAVRVAAVAAVICAVLVGAVAGRLAGAGSHAAGRAGGWLALPLGLAALLAAAYAAQPSYDVLAAILAGEAVMRPGI